LTTALAVPPLPALHPRMAEVYREKATALAAGLEHDEQRDAARLALRGFLEKIIIPPGDGLLQVVGNVGVMLAAAQGRTVHQSEALELGAIGGCGGLQPL
jgi:site-specific DNA recombinase